MKRTTQYSVAMPAHYWAALKCVAEADDRSISSAVRLAVFAYLEKRGVDVENFKPGGACAAD